MCEWSASGVGGCAMGGGAGEACRAGSSGAAGSWRPSVLFSCARSPSLPGLVPSIDRWPVEVEGPGRGGESSSTTMAVEPWLARRLRSGPATVGAQG